ALHLLTFALAPLCALTVRHALFRLRERCRRLVHRTPPALCHPASGEHPRPFAVAEFNYDDLLNPLSSFDQRLFWKWPQRDSVSILPLTAHGFSGSGIFRYSISSGSILCPTKPSASNVRDCDIGRPPQRPAQSSPPSPARGHDADPGRSCAVHHVDGGDFAFRLQECAFDLRQIQRRASAISLAGVMGYP